MLSWERRKQVGPVDFHEGRKRGRLIRKSRTRQSTEITHSLSWESGPTLRSARGGHQRRCRRSRMRRSTPRLTRSSHGSSHRTAKIDARRALGQRAQAVIVRLGSVIILLEGEGVRGSAPFLVVGPLPPAAAEVEAEHLGAPYDFGGEQQGRLGLPRALVHY